MGRFLLRRLAGHALLLVTVCSLAYLLAASALDPRSNYEGQQPPPPPHVVDAVLDRYNLNDRVPLSERYVTWAADVLAGDFGRTWDGRSVNEEMLRRVGVSLRLLAIGVTAGSVTGILLGAWAGSRQRGAVDRVSAVGAIAVISIPTVVIAVSLQTAALWANQAAGVDVFRTTGEFTPGLTDGFWAGLANRAQHLVLPTLTLALPQIAIYSRYQRNLMLDQVGADFVRTARAKGLTRRAALVRHALRTALIPAVTYFGYSFAALFTGAVFTEKVFGWHGVGEFLLDSVGRGDVNAVTAVCCFSALCVVAAALVVDVAHYLLDPRIRVG
ncbi:peptide/nickel transport system permease protein [Spinactinospora alkalitolerans]|uniref:Peptide/nickel transport system permease protein n=1 Tax=Spinactinospora alkalitolerans TaxID=687207 RepID=A0A852U2C6_9ACTN|nr:ABC transporter permease [Spinactinospora alkalitolerans]NYE49103.1 peptide/nickel transport system permease protein [Spinactinospora alkalitolerans]